MSTVKATHFEHPSASTPGITLASDGSVVLPSGFTGGIGTNVVQAVKTGNFTTTSVPPTFVDVTGLSVTITPSSASSKILLLSTVTLSNSLTTSYSYVGYARDGTAIARASGGGTTFMTLIHSTSAQYSVAFNFLDSPATTSAVTYTVQLAAESGSTARIGERGAGSAFTTSTFTAIEVAA